MINPSTNGWINKFFLENKSNYIAYSTDFESFYDDIRTSGFIYGFVVKINLIKEIDTKELSDDEITKIALLNVLFSMYRMIRQNENEVDFLQEATNFYRQVYPKNNRIFLQSKPNLEDWIGERIQTNENIFTKSYSHLITNAFLYMDVLAFKNYLEGKEHPLDYLKKTEEFSILLIYNALHTKENPTKQDELLIKMFANSLRYTKIYEDKTATIDIQKVKKLDSILEKWYFLDLAAMVMWSDKKMQLSEINYLQQLCKEMQLENSAFESSFLQINKYILAHKNEIPYFNFSHPVKHFYEQTNKNVTKLIKRNAKRLSKEIQESKELMLLLAKSTTKDLDEIEKKKVKKQLLDICKTIPSLTIFLLPGGSILLPILIKYIPQLLPSTFNENLE